MQQRCLHVDPQLSSLVQVYFSVARTLALPNPPFFFYGYGPPRDLHSFPTRRSSDLPSTTPLRSTKADTSCGHRLWMMLGRSEEHTSELQSHSDLVCRLLLEKKKNQRTRSGRPRTTP